MNKKWLLFALKLALSVFLIGFLFSRIDLGQAIDRALTIQPEWAVAAFALMLAQIGLGAVRWSAVLAAISARLKFSTVFAIYCMGTFFNQVLPSSVGGDAVRMYKAYKAGLALPKAVNGVMLERIAMLVALVAMVAVLQPALLERIGDRVPVWIFPTVTTLAVVGIIVLMLFDRLPETFMRWKLARGLAHLGADTRGLFLRPRHAATTLGTSLVGHVNLSLIVYVLAVGLDIPVSLFDCILLVPPIILITTLPISIAGWGLREGAMVAGFGFIGVAAESALVMSILFGLLTIVSSLPGGVIWLLSADRSAQGLNEEAIEDALAGDDASNDASDDATHSGDQTPPGNSPV